MADRMTNGEHFWKFLHEYGFWVLVAIVLSVCAICTAISGK
jgi:hypothetical protein